MLLAKMLLYDQGAGFTVDNVENGKAVYVYVDESGSITKTNISNNRYFVIAMLFTEDPVAVRRLYKKRISKEYFTICPIL